MESSSSRQQHKKIKEIPSSLDLRPIGDRYVDTLAIKKTGNNKFAHVKSKTDTGFKEKKTVMETDNTIRVTKLKGENFGRIAHNVLSRYIIEGEAL